MRARTPSKPRYPADGGKVDRDLKLDSFSDKQRNKKKKKFENTQFLSKKRRKKLTGVCNELSIISSNKSRNGHAH